MNGSDYKPNSHKYKEGLKEEKKKVEKVVKGTVKTKKKSELSKLGDVFISEDAKGVGSYIFMDVLVPTIKKAIVDIVTDGINMVFFGGDARGKSSKSQAGYVAYSSYSDRNRSHTYSSARTRTCSYDDIIFESRGEAEEVLSRMDELVDKYGIVSVADMYDLAGLSCPYTYNDYGWTSIRNADVVRTRNGYEIKMSKALPIK